MYDKYYKVDNENIVSIGFEEGFCDNPREWNDFSTCLTWQRNYVSPDKNDYDDVEEFLWEVLDVEYTGYGAIDYPLIKESAEKKGLFLFPVYFLDHTSQYYSLYDFNDKWDSGMVGFMFVEKEKVFKETILTPTTDNLVEEVKRMLELEIDTYNDWANGNVMQYAIYNLKENDITESCGGFIGDEPSENGIMDYLPSGYELTNDNYLGEYNSFNECICSLVSCGRLNLSFE